MKKMEELKNKLNAMSTLIKLSDDNWDNIYVTKKSYIFNYRRALDDIEISINFNHSLIMIKIYYLGEQSVSKSHFEYKLFKLKKFNCKYDFKSEESPYFYGYDVSSSFIRILLNDPNEAYKVIEYFYNRINTMVK